jgi:hypothetical protein
MLGNYSGLTSSGLSSIARLHIVSYMRAFSHNLSKSYATYFSRNLHLTGFPLDFVSLQKKSAHCLVSLSQLSLKTVAKSASETLCFLMQTKATHSPDVNGGKTSRTETIQRFLRACTSESFICCSPPKFPHATQGLIPQDGVPPSPLCASQIIQFQNLALLQAEKWRG